MSEPTSVAPYPLLLRPVLLEKVWGGRALAQLGKALPKPDGNYGESWEIADLASTSASGAGGAGVRSVIENGPLAGRTLHDAAELWGERLFRGGGTPGAAYPLLVKFLDAREDLSVQVHPSAEYARTHAGAHLKTECWYILGAAPGAVIYSGLRAGVTRERFERAARAGDRSIVELLEAIPARAGDMHTLPSGTVHALGAGVLVAEVQTPSDTTFRLYDWGRTGRELHIEPAIQSSLIAPAPPATRLGPGESVRSLVKNEYFEVIERRVVGEQTVEVSGGAVIVLSGGVEVRCQGYLGLAQGQAAVIPAACAAEVASARASSDARILQVRIC